MASPRNVFIVGAQSTGKTTLVTALGESLSILNHANARSIPSSQPSLIREVARTVLQTRQFSRDDLTSSASRALQLQQLILEAQLEAETIASSRQGGWYISDRSGIDPIAYAKVFVDEEGARGLLESPAWAELEQHMKDGLVFLCEAGVKWLIDDGTRAMPKDNEDWMRLDRTFRELLEATAIEYTVIPKSLEGLSDRVSLVLKALEESL